MKKIFTLLLCVFSFISVTAQTTTSSIKGIVKSSGNELLPGATILAIHTPTGTKYSGLSNEDGRFSILNMRIGGPYKIVVSFVGYQNQEYNDVYLDLGKVFNLDVLLADESQALEEVKVVSKNKVFQSGRTGVETTIGRRELTSLPTISRSAEDFTRLEPTASGGSFGGRNDQYNNYSLNGAVFNNPFGLDAATPGGQTGAQPISLDAIEQIQVATAPYDVTLSGFTGASVNAVTKSGTNEFHGTAYAFYRNQDLTGSKIKGEKIFVPSLEQTQAGFSLGAPIIKDKLFVFGNFEIDKRSDLGSNFGANNNDGVAGINESRVLESDLIAVSNALANLGYNTGAYQGFKHESNSSKGIIKLDWNINDNHKLAVIYNFLDSSKDKPAHPTALGFRGPNASILQFQNSGYQINNKLSSFLLELNSKFSESVSNKLQAGYTHFDDYRVPFSVPAPVINIQDGSGANYIIAGHEPFSINNTLDQKVIQITDNLTYTVGKHAFTFGTSFEKFQFKNSFNLAGYDNFGNPNGYAGTFFTPYSNVQAFLDDAARPYASSIIAQNLQYAQDTYNSKSNFAVGSDGGWKLAELNVGQLAFYAQDDISLTDHFKLSLGLRVDKPLYFDTADLIQKYIDTDNGGAGRDNTVNYFDPETGEATPLVSTDLPSDRLLWSPRIGFNWDVKGDATSQLRGGSGIFTGRIPFVWLGNQVSGADDSFFQIMDPDYKWPQVWRTSLGYDHRFESNYIVTFDMSYNKDINGVQVQNWGLKAPTGTLAGADNRLIYTAGDKGANNAYVMTNSDKGSAFNASVKVQKSFDNGLYASLAYNYMKSQDVNSIEAEITGDAFAFNPALGNVNNAVLSNSKYGDNHRFIGVASKKWKYGKDKWATTVSTFFEYAQGGRFNYTYGGDINNDGSAVNDLIYVPTTAEIGQMTFTGAGQGEAFDKFISQDKYLRDRRGEYVERYGAIAPWRGRWDLKLLQDYNFKVSSASEKKNTIQFSIDVLNIGNLLNSDWGLVQNPTSVQPIGVSVVGTTPTYTFTNTQTKTFNYDASLASRWQAQFGIRYIF
ncbi:carboxypeptidase regulatory-like domain-containing protein [Flavobacterium sp. Fl-77]|uniref:Carboxypeptidase regulatory-like domain-containing protein n=1 Tax=Flavobacterium flavipigmentatum TaxID=2893884 RepID=A0AAJ2SCQ3_9FLAO|nr:MULTISPECIES: carboxypeptidase regulatory-like domain-containing protein [unclassified Flavobacterium]MDX6181559.1 carboxypeptidase regulatory-like domain-containing protein [Flavobacterium sp. Fl-33]MDX6185407.1 carboxypeptidase regulatory-like domain-containing protein [Flavobacterium sp. Fl-77]UFH37510.1 carboxypeptidase regulatory-like domain-containing protein [Flavobacterium sp. F-70]